METIIKTPHLDAIPLIRWFATDYDVNQVEEIEVCIENHIWITAYKAKIPVREMESTHIKNCINCWEGKSKSGTIIPAGYLGGKAKWLKIFNDELLNRQ